MKPFYFARLIIPIAVIFGLNCAVDAQTQTFSTPGGPYQYTVPLGVTQVGIDLAGGQGAGSSGGNGGRVTGNLAVTGGQILYIYVGGAGSGSTGGANGGASGGQYGGGGGSDIRTSASGTAYTGRLVVAGGGGGESNQCSLAPGGVGGYPNGTQGGSDACYGSCASGTGGTQTGPGSNCYGYAGGFGYGGTYGCCYGGQGGGGYYGGGGGYYYGPGGGGSSYYSASVTNVTTTNGTQTGNGYVTIYGPTLTASPASINFGAVTSGTTSVPPIFFLMNGSFMGSGPLTIQAPANVELWNSSSSSWTAPGGSITYTYSGNSFTNAGVYLKFVAPALAGTYCGNIVITGGGLSTPVNVNACGTSANVCAGSIPPGTSVATPSSGGVATQFVLSLVGAPLSGGLTYQWQTSTSGSPGSFTNIPGAVLPTYSFTGISANLYYQCVVTCSATGSSQIYGGSPAFITYQGLSASSCTPSCVQTAGTLCSYGAVGSSAYPLKIKDASGTVLMSDNTACGLNKYTDQTGTGFTCTLAPATTYTISVGSNTSGYLTSTQIWIDYNNNGTFDPSTEVLVGQGNFTSVQAVLPFTIPATVTPGQYRMRVESVFSNGFAPGGNTSYPCYPSEDPCPQSTREQYAETRDYKITIGPAPCSGTPNPGLSDATSFIGCNGFNTTLFDVIAGAPSGLTYQWMQSPTIGGYFNCSGSSASPAYTATVTTTGVTYYVCKVTCTNGGGSALTNPIAVTLNPPPAPITGANTVCNGQTVSLSSSPGTGTWTSGNTSIETVVSAGGTGNVTGVAVGGTNITYTLPTGCFATYSVNVLTSPAPIGGSLAVCASGTTSLSDPTTGGTWTSATPSLLTVGSSSGLVTAAPVGSTSFGTIIWTLPDGCSTSATVTVNPNPTLFIESVSGSSSYCAGSPSTADIRLAGSQLGFQYQLQLGGIGISTLTGTGGLLDFGVQTATGIYKVLETNPTTGCTSLAPGSVTVAINPTPVAFPVSVSGSGAFCAGSPATAPHVILGGSQTGVNYQLYLNGFIVPGALFPGTGTAIDFGAATSGGTYTIVATSGAGCTAAMTGSAIVIVNPLPTAFTVTGGGPFCAGTAGVDIGLSFSNTGISYQLYNGGLAVGPAVMGTGAPLDFGMQTANGTYSVVATNVSTACTNNMSGTPSVFMNALPNAYSVNGGGSFCAGGTGVSVGMAATDPGVSYQLYLGGAMIGGPQLGSGLPLSFPAVTTAGNYTVIATDPGTTCANNMIGSATVAVNPLPNVYNMTGGGNFCSGGTGVSVGLSGSNSGVSYQLFNGGAPGATLSGTGGILNYGLQTTTGTYTVVATNTTTHCSATMSGASIVGINPLPAAHNVTGSGSYCAGGAGVDVGLDFSDAGVKYQLFVGGVTPVGGTVAGTGAPLDFGNMTTAGTYTVGATNIATGCTNAMSGSAVISINPLPATHLVTGGGSYCAGGTGLDVGLNGSNTGVNYQLMLGLTPFGSSMPGTGSTLDFGLQVLPGTYTVIATDGTTGCSRNMVGGASVNINANPTPFNVTGGGIFCAGGTGVHLGLSGSTIGVKYQLSLGGVPVGSLYSGSGSALDFGAQVNTGTYTVVATNNSTGCRNNMTGSATVATNPAPPVYSVTGGGAYCSGAGGVDVGLGGSDYGINYQLMMGTTPVGTAVAGTGFALDFGNQTTAGTYSVVATDGTTGCSDHMAASANVAINALPTVYTVGGGGNYCAGGAGYHIFLTLSTPGISYQLYNGGATDGLAIPGTGAAIDFGLHTTSGTYTVVATNPSTTCTNNMSGSATININPLPATHNVTGGGSYCPGGAGATIGLDGSDAGIKYQLVYGVSGVGAPVSGTGSALTFGMHSPTGSYSVVATNSSTGCVNNMTGSATVNVATPPAIYSVTGGGTYCAGGIGLNIGLSNSDANVNYQLYNGSAPSGIALPGTGGAIDFGRKTGVGTYTAVATDVVTGCTSHMSGSAMINVAPVVLPHVTVTPSIAGTVCVGQAISFTASPVNGGTAPTYQWMVNGVSAGVGSTYTYIPVNGDVVTATIHSNQVCAIPDTGSSSMTVAVSPMEMPSATVAVNPGTLVCTGTAATFTATPMFGGTAPSLTWVKNGIAVANGTSYTYTPTNGDIVTFMLGSNFNCRLADTVFSTPATMEVQDPVIPTVAVTANPGANISAGTPVTFKAVVTHGGPALSYQWIVNSTPVAGANAATYTTSTLADRDSVTCQITGVCGLVGFNEIVVRVNRVGVAQVTAAGSDVRLIPNPNKGEFTVKGTLATTVDQEVTIEVTDMIGQVVYSGTVMTHNGVVEEHIRLNGTLANGMYLLNLRSGSENNVFHFVVEQ